MFDYLLTEEQKKIRDEARDHVKWVPRQMILDMDNETIKFPKEFLQKAARRNLLGLRYAKKYGGRVESWLTAMAVIEKSELACDAIIRHDTEMQNEMIYG